MNISGTRWHLAVVIAACCFGRSHDLWAGISEDCTVLEAVVTPSRVPAGSFFRATYRWEAPRPLRDAYTVFVHYRDDRGRMVFQGDHAPSVGTGTPGWQGDISYEQRVIVPLTLADGTYRIVVGLYNKKGRARIKAGDGVMDLGGSSYQVGTFTVDRTAPRSKADTEKPPSLELRGYRVSFSEDFDDLSVSPWGPCGPGGTRWIAHTPWAGDFGDAAFTDPRPGFPFTITDGILRIEARKGPDGRWRAGLLASNDPRGRGFSQQYGYFEMRAKMPPGPGQWPAFWFGSSYDRTVPGAGEDGAIEFDAVEYYGHMPNAYTCGIHVWQPAPHHGHGSTVITRENEPTTGFHLYGMMVDPEWITMYFDRVEVWKTPTPAEHNKPLMILLNLALGSGWPIDKTPNPSYMYVDYVRVWSDQVGTPEISPDEGSLFGKPVEVTMTADPAGARIRYTTDGSEPTKTSRLYTRPFSVSSVCTVRAKAFKRGLKPSGIASAEFKTITLREPDEPPAGTAAGLTYRYYEGRWTKLPDFGSLTPAATGTVADFDISKRRREDEFGLVFTGYVEVPSDGVYTFYTTSDDGSRLLVGEKVVVDNDGAHGPIEASGRIGLMAGKHAVSVSFFEWGGGETLKVEWSGPGFGRQEIPASALSH